MIRHPMLLTVLIAGFLSTGYAQEQLRPVVLSPDHEHDRFVTEPRDRVLEFRAYTASFDSEDDDNGDGTNDLFGVSHWVSYQLNAGPKTGSNSRPDDWIAVPQFSKSPTDESYSGSGFSRGHMCMRAHAQRLGTDANFNTYCVANGCPQIQPFNGGHWHGLEDFCALWADKFGKVWITCGPIFANGQPVKFIGDDNEVKVGIPEQFFKIVARDNPADPDRPHVLAFIYDHDEDLDSKALTVDHRPFLHSVDEIEAATGLNFFSALSEDDQDAIESTKAAALWPTSVDGGLDGFIARMTDAEGQRLAAANREALASENFLDPRALRRVRDAGRGNQPMALNALDAPHAAANRRSSRSKPFRIGTWNLKWFFDHDTSDDTSDIGPDQAASSRAEFRRRVKKISEVIAELDLTVCALQEIENKKVVQDLADELSDEHQQHFDVDFKQGRDTYTGQDVAFLVRSGFDGTAKRFRYTDAQRNSGRHKNVSKHAYIDIDVNGESIRIVNVHLITTPAKRKLQARSLWDWIKGSNVREENVIVIGDTNVSLEYDRTTSRSDIGIIRGLHTRRSDDDLHDLHAQLPRRYHATHRSGKPLDRILISQSLFDEDGLSFYRIRNERSLGGNVSDHFPLIAEFRVASETND